MTAHRAHHRPPIVATLAIIAMLPVVATLQQVGITTAGGAVATITACVVLLLCYSELVNWAGNLASELLMAGFDATIEETPVAETVPAQPDGKG